MKNIDETAILPFANSINTTEDLFRLIEQLEGLQRYLYKGKAGYLSVKALEFLSPDVSKIFKEIESLGLEPIEEDKQMDFVDSLIRFLRNITVLKMTVAYIPTEAFTAKVSGDVSKQFGKKVILELSVDESVVGGAAFEFLGKYANYTYGANVTKFVDNFWKAS